MLSQRAQTILKIIVSEYINTASPVPSERIVRSYSLGVSPATIRSEMARLEEEGFITRPHISAGGIPSDKAYRHYVESLIDEGWLPPKEQAAIKQVFRQVTRGAEEWARLATALLSQRLSGVGLASAPQARECRFKRMELVLIQEFLVLLVVVLGDAKLVKELLTIDSPLSQDELTVIANRANDHYSGLTRSQVSAMPARASAIEQQVKSAMEDLMQSEDEHECGELYLDGMRHLLAQPEFTEPGTASNIVEMLEDRRMLRELINALSDEPGLRVTIGSENKDSLLKGCTIILRSYGVPGQTRGAIGIIGPTRMQYHQALPTVEYLSSLMTQLTEKVSD
jgi:heat-inducible transcriptional repressor